MSDFEKGYEQAIADADKVLMTNHERVKNSHNFYHVAANMIKELTNA